MSYKITGTSVVPAKFEKSDLKLLSLLISSCYVYTLKSLTERTTPSWALMLTANRNRDNEALQRACRSLNPRNCWVSAIPAR